MGPGASQGRPPGARAGWCFSVPSYVDGNLLAMMLFRSVSELAFCFHSTMFAYESNPTVPSLIPSPK